MTNSHFSKDNARWTELSHTFRQITVTKGITPEEVLIWVAEHLDQFPESRRAALLWRFRYAIEQTFDSMFRDQQFTGGN